jgi:hypothetical protein
MKTLLAAGALVALAAPAFAEEDAAAPARLSELETMVITAIKEEPASPASTERLRDFETMTITAPKEQPKEHEVDSKTAALLATLEKE